MASNIGMMPKLYEFLGVEDFDGFVAYIASRDENERYRLLAEFLQTHDPAEVTPGYAALAELCADAVFDVVLTTNLDPLLDDALAAASLRRRDFLLFINGVVRTERLPLMLRSRSPRVKVIKLHGDLFHRFMAWTPPEMETYLGEVAPTLTNVLQGRDVLVVGYSVRDPAVRALALGLGGALWYVNPAPPPEELRQAASLRAVVGKDQTFETLFTKLEAVLGRRGAAAPAPDERRAGRRLRSGLGAVEPPANPVETIDDLMAAVVGLARTETGPPEMTGFLVAEPRVIVTDGWAGNVERFAGGRVLLVTSDGHRLNSRIRLSTNEHVFGPALVDAPEGLRGTGLRLDATALGAGTRLQVAVAAGERIGLSSGAVTTGKEQRLDIQPIGLVSHLLHVRLAVAPGSSGAPAVDEAMRVRGFVVAGSVDADHPNTFLLPTARWAQALRSSPGSAEPPKRRRARTQPRPAGPASPSRRA